jgi:predicted nucleotidyltransferase
MDTLTKSDITDIISQLVMQHLSLFDSFINVYLFGSILSKSGSPNDIDLLLIYTGFSDETLYDVDNIYIVFENIDGLSIDLTVLSIEEEKETRFIERLKSKYLKLK